jgi:hypothetical protein
MNFIILVPRLLYFTSFFDSLLAAGIPSIFSILATRQVTKNEEHLARLRQGLPSSLKLPAFAKRFHLR